MSKVFEYMKPYTSILLCAVLLLVVEAYCALILPGYMADIVNDGVLPGHLSVIWRNGAIMLAITLLSIVAAVITGYFTARTATGVANDLRAAVFGKVLHFGAGEVNRFSTSSLVTRTTNDIVQIQNTLMMAIRQFIYAPLIGVGGIVRALNRSVSMTWIVALATLIMVGTMAILFFVALPKFTIWQSLIDRLNVVTRENLSGILIVRAFSTQKFEKKRFDKANKDLAQANLFVEQTYAFMMPIIMLVMNLTTALVVWVGAREVSAFRIDIGDIFAFLMVGIMLVMLPRAVVAANRVKEVLETQSSLLYKSDPLPLPENFEGTVQFRDVSFRYPDATESEEGVLENISFTALPGQTTAIIGATGSGKTSIFKLLLRFFDVTGGSIHVDGIDIRDLRKQDLHDKIGYVPQNAILFTGSIHSNLIYADKNATSERISDAVDTAQATAFIAAKTEGYKSNVAQRGSNLSGGQRQRLSIARALVKDAQIYLFDDSSSALDLKTDALMRAALKKKMGNSTVLVIAQRVASIMDADQIVVLDHGKIVGLGTHSRLLESCKIYKEIAASQLSEEELNI